MSDNHPSDNKTTADLAWLEADLSAVEDLLAARTAASDPVGWMQFQQRKAELESRIATLKGGTSQTTALYQPHPEPGQVWRPTRPGTGKRIVCHQHVDPDPNTVSYKTPSGVRRRVWLREWNEWVSRWRCEVENHG